MAAFGDYKRWAFTHALAVASWLPPNGFICIVQELNARKGGTFRMTFENFSTGNSHSFCGIYVDFKPGESLKYTDKFDDSNLPGEMTTSITLKASIAGTEIRIAQEGIPDAIPVDMCYLGWQVSMEKLVKLVEPQIPDA